MPNCHICGKADIAMLCVCGECAKPRWIPVSERLPEVKQKDLSAYATDNGESFLVCHEDGYVDVCSFWARGNTFSDDDVTHWMPLPKPPEGGKG